MTSSPSSSMYSGDISIPESVNYNLIPYNVTSIGDQAFFECTSLTSITIPNSVTNIGDFALGCFSPVEGIPDDDIYIISKLQAINVDADNPNFTSINGVLYDKEVKRLIQYPIGKKGAYTIPNTVDSVDFGAAYGSYITELTIPGNVKKFGEISFMYCHAKDIYIHEGVEIIPNSMSGGVFGACLFLEHLSLPNSLKSIGNNAFTICNNLREIILGSNIEYIGRDAFNFDIDKCNHIMCLSEKVPSCEQNFITLGKGNGISYSEQNPSLLTVYVPYSNVDDYKADANWGKFTIKSIKATSVEVTEVNLSSTNTTVEISWPQVSGAASYELVIKDKDGNIICTLIFNAQGQLTSIAFHAPSRSDAPQQTQTAGFAFTVTGLEEGTTYNYTLTAKNSSGQVLKTEQGIFTTESLEGIEDIEAPKQGALKVLHEGQVYILRSEKIYTLQGQEVK